MRALGCIATMACLALAPGCVGPELAATGAGVTAGGTPHNIARQDPEVWETATSVAVPHNAVIDSEGVNVQTAGYSTVLGLTLPDGVKLFTDNPSDTKFARLVYTAGDGSTIEIEGFESIKSSVIAASDAQYLAFAETVGVITREQAAVAAKLVEGGMTAVEAILTVLGGV